MYCILTLTLLPHLVLAIATPTTARIVMMRLVLAKCW